MNKLLTRASRIPVFSSSDFILKALASFPALICLVLFISARTASAQEGMPRPEASPRVAAAAADAEAGRLSGRIIADDGKPLANVVVSIYRIYARVAGPPLTTSTDAEGRFQSSVLQPGFYSVSAMAPGYALALPDINEAGDSSYYRPGQSVSLTMVKGGVITGTVRDVNGEPVVGVPVRALRVRGSNPQQSILFSMLTQDRMTDDRGVYRIYGLAPGTYLVVAGGGSRFFGVLSTFDGDVPTYFPSSTRDTAAEVNVQNGEEATNVDIRYRGERGRTISGRVSGMNETDARTGISIILRQTISGGLNSQTFIQPSGSPSFSFDGLTDGEYEIVAQQGSAMGDQIASTPRRVTIKGMDVTGVELALTPLASISGRAVLEPAPKEPCSDEPAATLSETIINVRRDEKGAPQNSPGLLFFSASGTLPDDQGDFTLRNLAGGNYRLNLRLPNESWYARSLSLPGATATTITTTAARPPASTTKSAQAKSAPAAPSYGITLRSGERVTGALIQLAQDGATVRGKITMSVEGANLPDNLKVYLIPQERERAEDILRFSEARVRSDGAFTLRNLAPGRYFIIAPPAPENLTPESLPRPVFWDTDARAKLRRQAEALNAAIDLKPCQRIGDYELRYPAVK